MAEQVRVARTRRVRRITWKLGWHQSKHDKWITGRIHTLLTRRTRWYDWGHRVMILVGDPEGGSYAEPSMGTWWYRLGPPKRMWRTNYPTHPLSTFEIIKDDYNLFRERTHGLNEDQMYEWKAIALSQDGELILGHRYWGGAFYGMTKWETALLRKYLRAWRRHDWWGLRSWLYSQALNAAVHQRKPFACQAIPPKNSGGYNHWHCQNRRGHKGEHRYNAMTWIDDVPVVISDQEREQVRAALTASANPQATDGEASQ